MISGYAFSHDVKYEVMKEVMKMKMQVWEYEML
jgi:hypothetical protein